MKEVTRARLRLCIFPFEFLTLLAGILTASLSEGSRAFEVSVGIFFIAAGLFCAAALFAGVSDAIDQLAGTARICTGVWLIASPNVTMEIFVILVAATSALRAIGGAIKTIRSRGGKAERAALLTCCIAVFALGVTAIVRATAFVSPEPLFVGIALALEGAAAFAAAVFAEHRLREEERLASKKRRTAPGRNA